MKIKILCYLLLVFIVLIVVVFGIFTVFKKSPNEMAAIPTVSKISSRITRVLGCNPGPMTLQGTNTYILGTGSKRILIDTGDENISDYVNHLGNVLKTENINLSHIFISHWHHDHIGGLTGVLSQLKDHTANCSVWKFPCPEHDDNSTKLSEFLNHQEFSVDGATLRVIHTPGHSTDHAIFHLIEDNAIFSADCILGEGTAVFEDLYDYMKSLNLILDLQPSIIYPGHGNIIKDPIDRIKYYISHRQKREDQIMEVLQANKNQTFNENDLVLIIYEGLAENLIKAAESNVNHHLQKLFKEGKVKKNGDLWQYNEIVLKGNL